MKKTLSFTLCTIFILILSLSAFSINSSAATLPSQYNNNAENPMYVTSVKNQYEYGVCWAFSAISCCESEAIKNHGADKNTLDLSELHLAYFAYNGERIGTGDTVSVENVPYYEIGGDISLAMLTLSNWIGLVSENTAPFEDFLENPNITLDPSLAYKRPEYYIKNAYRYSYATDIALIKQAIMDFGAIQTGYFADDTFLNPTTSAYYCPQSYTMNHAISVIGWDDNYPKENFSGSSRPTNNGAWLVKNSWGEEQGIGGYFWLSYEDKSIQDAVAYDVEPASTFLANNNYQHDGGFSLTYYSYEKINAANVFTAKDNESIVTVSVFAHKANNTPYTLKIYKNPSTLSPQTFTSGQLIYEQSGTLTFSGLNSIDLTSHVPLKKGDTFIVSIETSAILGFDGTQQISDGQQIISQSIVSVQPNQSYISVDGGGFYDLSTAENGARPTNARIKAFTKSDSQTGEATLSSLPTMEPITYGKSLKRSKLSGGEVIDSISGKAIDGKWSFKSENRIVPANATIDVIFTPTDHRYDSIEATISANIIPMIQTMSLNASPTTYKSGEPILFDLTIYNTNLDGITDFGSITYTYRVDDGPEEEFTGPVFEVKDLSGKTLYVTVTVSAVKGKYEENSATLSFPIEQVETETETETVTETETETETDIYTNFYPDFETEDQTFENVTDSYITETFTQEAFTETNEDFTYETEESLTEEATKPFTEPTVTESDSEIFSENLSESVTEETSSEDVYSDTDTKNDEDGKDSENKDDTEDETDDATKETSKEETKNIEDQLSDLLNEDIFGCSSSISLSALCTVFALSAITLTKKRKR